MSNKTQSQGTENYIETVVSTALPHFHHCGIRLPLSLSLDPSMATLWCSFRSERDWAGVDQGMLVLTEFPAVVVSIKLEFYVNWREWDGQTHACVGTERNVTYFSVNKLLFVWLVRDNGE